MHLPGYLIHTVACAYKCKVPSRDLQVVYDQFVPSHRAILSLLNGHAYRCHLVGGSPPPHNGGNRAILTNR